MLGLIGLVDYSTGFEMMFSVFYLLEVGLAAWFLGRSFGYLMSVLSVAVWIGGDIAAGAHYSSPLVPVWNAVLLIIFYWIVVMLMSNLRSFHRELEEKVAQRTKSLTREMRERERLEGELIKVSEREQQRIGHDLHDGLCQHLTATALAGKVLAEQLSSRGQPESAHANRIVDLVEEGISMARDLAHGLNPVLMKEHGLANALDELTSSLSKNSKLSCLFECEGPVSLKDENRENHLYRIAQESIANAIRHGKANNIRVTLSETNDTVQLTIEDDGVGFPENWEDSDGHGVRIMRHRAAMLKGEITIEPAITGGATVTCHVPSRIPSDNNLSQES